MINKQYAQEQIEKFAEANGVTADEIIAWWKTLDGDSQDGMLLLERGILAREDSPEGYENFYWCINGLDLPRHAFYTWILPAYWARGLISREKLKEYFDREEAQKFRFAYEKMLSYEVPKIGVSIQASRELTKTTVMTIGFTAFRIGLEPHRANLLVQVGDDIAKDNSGKIAEIIEDSPGWRACFPNVVPDKKKGWGEKGYEVIDTSLTRDKWMKKIATRKDPTLLGVGYSSRAIIGKHPDGVLAIDDIHDENNTVSEKELRGVIKIVTAVILYAMTHETWVQFIGTPWVQGDTLDYIKDTGEYVAIVVPAYLEREGDTLVFPTEWKDGTEKVYMWPELRGEEWVRRKKATSTTAEFARMVVLNLLASHARTYKYQRFDHKEINWEWPIVAGVDPVATTEMIQGKEGGTSHFAMAYAMKTPQSRVVIGDGVLQKCSAEEGERQIVAAQKMYKRFERASIEMDGAGAIFMSMISRNPGLIISPHATKEIGARLNKAQRQYKFLEPLLKNGLVLVSDADTPFLRAFRRYLERFPNFSKDAPEWDVADAVVWAVYDIPEIWTMVATTQQSIFEKKKERKNPYAGIGRHVGYGR